MQIVPAGTLFFLVDPFCVEADTFFEFRLAMTMFTESGNNLRRNTVELLIDGMPVASAGVRDGQ